MTIATRDRQVDISVPADVPIALLLPDIVALASHDVDRSTDRLALSRIGKPPLAGATSLRGHGIADGDLLVLSTPSAPVEPLFDDVASVLSGTAVARDRTWSRMTAQVVTWACAAALLLAAGSTLVWGPGSADTALRIGAAFGTAAMALLCSLIAARTYRAFVVSAGLGVTAAAMAFTGAVVAIPNPRLGGVLFGSVLAATASIITVRIADRGHTATAAVAYLALLIAPAALLGTLTTPTLTSCAALVTVCGVAGLTGANRLSVTLSRLPIPALPGPLASPERDADYDLPSFADLQAAAIRADRYLAGFVGAATAAVVLGVAGAALAGPGLSWRAVALGAASSILLGLRSRTYAAAAPAAAVLAGATGVVLLVALAIAFRGETAVAGFAVAAVAAGLAVAVGTRGNRELTPPMRRAIDLLELTAIAVAVPLACWVGGLFDSLSLR